MTDKNVLDFNKFKRKNAKDAAEPAQDYNLEMAKKTIESDPRLYQLFSSLGISLTEGADLLLKVSELSTDIAMVTQKYSEQTRHNPVFSGLIVQVLSLELSDHLAGLGMSRAVTKDAFTQFQRNAIAPIIETKHLDDLTGDDGFNSFTDGEEHDDEH